MCQREKGAKQDDSPCASDEGTDWKSGGRREHLKVQTHALFTSLYLDDEQGYKRTAQPPLLYSLASAWRQYILNMPKITPGRNKWVSISDSHPTAVGSLPLRASNLPSLFFVLPSLHLSLFVLSSLCRTDTKRAAFSPSLFSSQYTPLSYFTC